ncbi:MAG: RNA 2',3'-cyclic phosphodiesterase [Candidatus Bathyarchaeia archaeon]
MFDRTRSFVAVDISSPHALSKLEEIQKLLVKTDADLKIVPKQNLHFTLKFLGEISSEQVQALCEEFKAISFTPFVAYIKGAGAFPSMSRINVIWVGLSEGERGFRDVYDNLQLMLKKMRLSTDSKGFSPHITLARVRTGRNKARLVQAVSDLADFDVGQVKVERVSLKKSVLTPSGPIYSTICEAPTP